MSDQPQQPQPPPTASATTQQLPPNPQDDNHASVQAALNKLHTLRKLSMSGTNAVGFTPLHSQSVSRTSSAGVSRGGSRPGSPGEAGGARATAGGNDDNSTPIIDLPDLNGPGDLISPNLDALSPGSRAAARMYSVPGTPHFGAQTDMLKTLDESTKVLKRAGGAGGGTLGGAGGGAATPSVSGIGTLLDRPDYSEAKIVVAMVGLPARGKSYLSNRLLRYLRWLEYKVEVFNVGQLRRRKARDQVQAGEGPQDHSHTYFSSTNPEATALREQLASESLESLIGWLKEGGNVGIHDATNSTKARRAKIQERIDAEPGFQCIFLESWCDDPEIIASNVALKARSGDPDYKGMSKEEAERDFRKRIQQYESVYETIEEPDISWCKILNVGRQVQINRIAGYLQSRIAFYLMNLHLKPRHIYLSRHGESMHNVGGMIGGDSPLSPQGEKYAAALPALVLENVGDHPLQVWTSTLQRTVATARNLPYPKKTWKSLDELDAGVCDGMTYEEIAEKYPEDYAARDENKFGYRYRGGESYQDVVVRLEPVIMELERQENIIIICHQAIIRCLYGYFMGLTQEELPYIKVPLHTLIKLTPMAYGCEEERFSLEIPAVDTHRPKPAARKNSHDAVASAPVEETDTATTTTKPGVARDYFGDAAPTATAHTAAPEEKAGDQEPPQHDVQVENEETTKMSAEKARQNILLQHAEEQGKKASEVTQEEASISQADIVRALQAQSAMSARKTAHMIKYSDLPKASAENALCAPVAADSAKKYNRHKMHCPRPECGSLILSTGTADWTVAESGMLPQDPNAPFDEDPKADASAHPDIKDPAPFWHVGGVPMVFENIGFTRNVKVEEGAKNTKQGLKWLICAECDIGPLGWCYEGETEAWLSPSRLSYAT